ncbi:hypothetical protein N8T08_001036 [Aspergillus melleus]|uniref:Uncharacterized protein n=1 Tax=Aspergillus melleus TaxID=138277 RepID=A0ACC3BAZ9_9EURO|nr:hypothetical protein N8T08_001036 [Aspergillus melleus]
MLDDVLAINPIHKIENAVYVVRTQYFATATDVDMHMLQKLEIDILREDNLGCRLHNHCTDTCCMQRPTTPAPERLIPRYIHMGTTHRTSSLRTSSSIKVDKETALSSVFGEWSTRFTRTGNEARNP